MVTTIIFFLALVGIVFLFWNKEREIARGEALVKVSFANDESLKQKIEKVKVSAKGFPRKAAHITAFYAVKHGLRAYDKAREVVYPKISHIVDAVKGKHIPRNRGSVSLFLKHIEEHQRSADKS